MTDLEKFRAMHGPIRWGTTRLLLALATIVCGLHLNFEWIRAYVSAHRSPRGSDVVLGVGLTVLAVLFTLVFYALAWAWLGFQSPKAYMKHCWRINWKGHNSLHFWMEGPKLCHALVMHDRVTPPPTGTHYSLVVPLVRFWGEPYIYDWRSCAPLGKVAVGLKVRVRTTQLEWFTYPIDLVRLQDSKGNRIWCTLADALTWWVPMTMLELERSAPQGRLLAVAARKLLEKRDTLDENVKTLEKNVRTKLSEGDADRKCISNLKADLICAFVALDEALDKYDSSRRLKSQVEAHPIFHNLRMTWTKILLSNEWLIHQSKPRQQ